LCQGVGQNLANHLDLNIGLQNICSFKGLKIHIKRVNICRRYKEMEL